MQTWAKYYDNLVETEDGTWKFQGRTVDVIFGGVAANWTSTG